MPTRYKSLMDVGIVLIALTLRVKADKDTKKSLDSC